MRVDTDSPTMPLVVEHLRLRASLYGLLSRAFLAEPTTEDIGRMVQAIALIDRLAQVAACAALSDACRAMMARLDGLADSEEAPHRLACEFARAFLVGAEAVAPYASVHQSEERLTMQAQRDVVLQFYRRHGLGRRTACTEPEDHIGLQLEFLSAMSSAAAECGGHELAANLAAQGRFLTETLLPWVSRFAARLQEAVPDGCYAVLARVLEGFLRFDRSVLLPALDAESRAEPLAFA